MKILKSHFLKCLLLVSVLFLSCSKDDNEETPNLDQDLLVANSQIDYANEVDFNTGLEIANDNSVYTARNASNSETSNSNCATITVDNANPGEFPKTFTIDFGAACTFNSITRSGTLTITFSDYVINYGSTMTIVRGNDYYINGRKLEGTIVYQNETTNSNIPQWSRTITNGKMTTLTGGVFTFSGNWTTQQTAGVGTLTLGDNIYEIISGTHTINRPNGTTLTMTVLETLVKKYACNYISQGKLNLQGTFLNGVLDYGDNTCDNQATYTHSNNQVYPINL
jgi:hypothetical protein